jgi:hypothetical protein
MNYVIVNQEVPTFAQDVGTRRRADFIYTIFSFQ